MYIYKKTETQLWTVGFYEPNGTWQPDEDFNNMQEAAQRVHYLNGGKEVNDKIKAAFKSLAHEIAKNSYWIDRHNDVIAKGTQFDVEAAEEYALKLFDEIDEALA